MSEPRTASAVKGPAHRPLTTPAPTTRTRGWMRSKRAEGLGRRHPQGLEQGQRSDTPTPSAMPPPGLARHLKAARVPESVASGSFGPWTIARIEAHGSAHLAWCGWPRYTALYRHSWASLHQPHGEIVMEDSRHQLCQHLPILQHARGRVLVTGLGLGCVVRALAANADVDRVDVLEIDRDIIERVGPEWDSDPRVTLIEHDALTYPTNAERWNFAWHDLWCDPHAPGGEPLEMLHAKVLKHFADVCEKQGAWRLPRWLRRFAPRLAQLW